jgi:hypothetical protein
MPRRKALIIGINYFGSSHQLNGCVNDAKNIRNFLVQDRGFSSAPHGLKPPLFTEDILSLVLLRYRGNGNVDSSILQIWFSSRMKLPTKERLSSQLAQISWRSVKLRLHDKLSPLRSLL